MAIYTFGVENVVVGNHGVVRTTNLRSTTAGHIFDVVAEYDLDNGMNVAIGDHDPTDGREIVKATKPTAADSIALVTEPVRFYDTSTHSVTDERNFYIPKGTPARVHQVEQYDKFGVSTNMFSTILDTTPAVGNFVTVDGAGKWKEVVSSAQPSATENAFIGKIYRLDVLDNITIVQIEVLQNAKQNAGE